MAWNAQLFSWRDFCYQYVRCSSCASLISSPAPTNDTLAELYGLTYSSSFPDPYRIETPRNTEWVVQFLTSRPPGTFADYGCGDGALLLAVTAMGWKAYGVELQPEVASDTSAATGCDVLCPSQLQNAPPADVVHMGDVLEHLPDPWSGLRNACRLLTEDGALIAQGPLEAGPSLFSSVVRPGRRRRTDAVEMAPYHLTQATANGQRAFFRRAGLIEAAYEVSEVNWPAPSRLSAKELVDARTVILYGLRRVSIPADRLATAVTHHNWGNRFRYVGMRQGGGALRKGSP